MARFSGTNKEFVKYVEPFIRNMVQYITRKERKKMKGICEFCKNSNVELESAHKHGKGRKVLISEVLKKYDKGTYFDVDLEKFETELRELHEPINEVFHFLCNECHKKYDENEKVEKDGLIEESDKKEKTRNIHNFENPSLKPLLTLLPDDDTFREKLLIHKIAKKTITYADGREKKGIWNASNFKETSNVKGNIWSGPLKKWEKKEIIGTVFEVKE